MLNIAFAAHNMSITIYFFSAKFLKDLQNCCRCVRYSSSIIWETCCVLVFSDHSSPFAQESNVNKDRYWTEPIQNSRRNDLKKVYVVNGKCGADLSLTPPLWWFEWELRTDRLKWMASCNIDTALLQGGVRWGPVDGFPSFFSSWHY